VHGLVRGVPPKLDLAREAALQRVLVAGAESGLIRSAHDCAEGGLAVAIAECCFDTGLGAVVDVNSLSLAQPEFESIATLFSESASRVVVSTRADRVPELLSLASREGVPATRLGIVGGQAIRIAIDGMTTIDISVADAEHIWANAIEQRVEAVPALA
jgi:phosphoribosylformylglycinamidine synthase